jgi:hypothetical protein
MKIARTDSHLSGMRAYQGKSWSCQARHPARPGLSGRVIWTGYLDGLLGKARLLAPSMGMADHLGQIGIAWLPAQNL